MSNEVERLHKLSNKPCNPCQLKHMRFLLRNEQIHVLERSIKALPEKDWLAWDVGLYIMQVLRARQYYICISCLFPPTCSLSGSFFCHRSHCRQTDWIIFLLQSLSSFAHRALATGGNLEIWLSYKSQVLKKKTHMLPVCFVSELKHLGVCGCIDARCSHAKTNRPYPCRDERR